MKMPTWTSITEIAANALRESSSGKPRMAGRRRQNPGSFLLGFLQRFGVLRSFLG
ncbi:MAG: hypothetical protein IPK93_03920 [Solirubrobacterales bacterium]|nr:hypothetical protein [Solirubrobacterales bacterium]